MDDVLVRINGLLGVRRGRAKDLAKYLGYTNSNIVSDWRAGRAKSYMKQLPKIAEFLGTTVEYLYGETDDPSPAPTAATPEQKEKAPQSAAERLTEGLDEESLKKLMEYAEFLKSRQEKKENQ